MPQNDPTPLTPDQQEFERALRSTRPAAGRVDPLDAAFSAGQKSARRHTRLWQTTTLLALAVAFIPRIPTTHRPPSDTLPVTAAPNTTAPIPAQSVLALQGPITQYGLDGLPQHPLPTVHPFRADDKL